MTCTVAFSERVLIHAKQAIFPPRLFPDELAEPSSKLEGNLFAYLINIVQRVFFFFFARCPAVAVRVGLVLPGAHMISDRSCFIYLVIFHSHDLTCSEGVGVLLEPHSCDGGKAGTRAS